MAAPMVGLSLLLLALGVVAAWYVDHLQRQHSDLLARDVSSLLVAEDLEIQMREVRNRLNRFLRRHDKKYLDEIPALRLKAQELLDRATRLARNPDEKAQAKEVEQGCRHFFSEVSQLTDHMARGDNLDAMALLVDEMIQDEILTPAHEYADFHRQIVARSSAQSQLWAHRVVLGLLLLGSCGSAAGLLAGFGIARGVSRSIVQLSVPVHGVAGKLNEVVGPITISTGRSFKDLESALQDMAEHVGTVIERLEQRELEVVRGEQLAAVGQLAAGIAHEVRNPLMAMRILVQAAAERGDGTGLCGRDLLVVDEEITRLEQSVQALLDFARPPQLAKSTADLRALVTQTLDLVSARAERQHVNVGCELPDWPVMVEADSGQIRQVLVNLLLNALDSLSTGGLIEVWVVAHEAPNERPTARSNGDCDLALRGLLTTRAAVASRRPGSTPAHGQSDCFCSIHVSDTGQGLPAELGDRIFEPFVSSKETGTGLGLSICRRIIEAHGGSITALDRARGGAEFVVWLPRAASPATGRDEPILISAAFQTGVP
jgi:signal transduction histidine kinase